MAFASCSQGLPFVEDRPADYVQVNERWADTCPFRHVDTWHEDHAQTTGQIALRLFYIFLFEKFLTYLSIAVVTVPRLSYALCDGTWVSHRCQQAHRLTGKPRLLVCVLFPFQVPLLIRGNNPMPIKEQQRATRLDNVQRFSNEMRSKLHKYECAAGESHIDLSSQSFKIATMQCQRSFIATVRFATLSVVHLPHWQRSNCILAG